MEPRLHGRPERTFAALPPAPGRAFAVSWWGKAWLKALEDTALDNAQLKAGRRLAREGRVGAVSVRPGRITAVVRDLDAAYRSDVLVQSLGDGAWERFLDMAVERSGHVAALLDREMPPHLVEDASSAGVDLLPGIGDLEPECSCEAWDHCAHSAALCYQFARLLDQDPFVLLLLRGRDERRLLEELRIRGTQRAEAPAPSARRGVPAAGVFAGAGSLPALPAPPRVPPEPGTPPSLDTGTGPAPGVDPAALEVLAADAAGRAHRMLLEALVPGHERQPLPVPLTPEQDAVRLAAGSASAPWALVRLSTATGRRRARLDAAVLAWRLGEAAALAVLEEEWEPDASVLVRAGDELAGAWGEDGAPALRRTGNRWTATELGVQLRLGRDGRWWAYRKDRGRWVPAGPAGGDPAGALAGAGAED
ncbi:SWF or SNF family helicase [Streptomyces sp. NBC_00102]|uniref:SWF or SNF family helicase n=1 Tax=Streptomyces sp. NBC_00102 TaxID=2975652 RepID=UPI002258E288|nr:SWF or SNF family helicase [Streptomyces sp. NBC_00102]MCX5401887.1 SWF or SNF family helicase [Streptomyces sp. NBC_00102]